MHDSNIHDFQQTRTGIKERITGEDLPDSSEKNHTGWKEKRTVFIHIFGFRWKPEATDSDKARAREEILAFRGVIPGLVDVSAGRNLSPRGQGYEFAGLMTFTDRAACDAYATHPAHLKLLEWLLPLIEPVELDFEA